MKCTLVVLVVGVCLLGLTQANVNGRLKREAEGEFCATDIDCEAYAEKKSKTIDACHTYRVNGREIHWIYCFYASCGENSKRVEDVSAPFPECCPRCEVIDKSKPAAIIIS